MDCGWPRIHVPESCKGVDIVVGIDEAGRGPVIGSLIYCGAFWPLSEHEEICKLGFDDSKALKEGDRERFLQTILNHPSIGWVIEEITAQEISEQMLRAHPVSLNTLSYNGVIRILETIRDIKPERDAPTVHHVYVDTVGDPSFYENTLRSALGPNFSTEGFTIEKKADATYKIVSAASIIAKVTRDHLTAMWTFKGTGRIIDSNYGSGYPSDEKCVEWMGRSLHPVFGYPSELVRFSWSTTKTLLEDKEKAVQVEWPCEEEERAGGNIASFFGGGEKKRKKRTDFYVKHKMKHIRVSDIVTQK